MINAKTKAAEALYTVLSSFHSLGCRPLQAVWQVYAEGTLERLILDFDEVKLTIDADENDDSIDLAVVERSYLRETGAVDGSHLDPWKDLLGKPFGWGWLTINQQGYCDGVLLSFGSIIPVVILNVAASSIKVGTVTISNAVVNER